MKSQRRWAMVVLTMLLTTATGWTQYPSLVGSWTGVVESATTTNATGIGAPGLLTTNQFILINITTQRSTFFSGKMLVTPVLHNGYPYVFNFVLTNQLLGVFVDSTNFTFNGYNATEGDLQGRGTVKASAGRIKTLVVDYGDAMAKGALMKLP
jgi:hypothetical protein